MSATYKLFLRWTASKNHLSARQAALALGVSPQTTQFWKEGRNGTASVIEKMAMDLDEDPMLTIIEAFRESGNADDKKTWTRIAKRYGAAALTGIMLTSTAGISDAKNAEILLNQSIHYANKWYFI